jgi:diguanylate cyclase (GGDEF)-like protein/PAS domain S-box-containing protein
MTRHATMLASRARSAYVARVDQATPILPLPIERGDHGRFYLLGGAVFIVLALLAALAMTAVLRTNELTEARRNLDQLSTALAEQTTRSLQAVDVVLQDTAHRVQTASAQPGANPEDVLASPEVNQLLRERLRSVGQLEAISLVDARGQIVNFTRTFPAPPINVADRDYFTALRSGSLPEPYVSAPVRSRVDRAWKMFMARRLDLGSAGFQGLVVGVVPLGVIERSFQNVVPPGSTATLLRNDGLIFARFPREEALIGKTALTEANEGRLVSIHALRRETLSVEVSMTEDAALEPWREQALGIFALTLAAVCCVALMLGALARQLRTQRKHRQALAQRNLELERARSHLERQTRELADTASALHGGEKLLAERSATLTTTLQYIDQGIMMVDASGTVVSYNQRVVEMLGIPDELLSKHPPFREVLQYQWETGEFSRTGRSLRDFVRGGGIMDRPQVYERERPNGRTIEVRSQPLPGGGIVRTYTDITERKQAEARIERAALVDELTGLPNRLSLRQALEQRLRDRAEGEGLALFYLNLDRFRLLNDARGHEVGDRLLIEVAHRLQAVAAPGDVVSRTGGDEFAILHGMAKGEDDSAELGDRLLHLLAEPHVINGLRLAVTVSVGVAVTSAESNTDTVLRNADIAMYRAKDAGRNQLCRYEPAMAVAQQERFQLEQSLREALGSHAFRLAYQPIVSLQSNAIAGYEALLRWTDRLRGEVSPQLFIPVAETTGLIVPLGRQVLEWACFEAASWPNSCTIAVNLSPVQFQGKLLLETVQDALRRSGLAPERLELEVTEGVLLEDTGTVHETMVALRNLGVSLTLDDFGTGHAGLSYLRRFPFSKIKIDRSFVRNLGGDRESDAIVEAILLLGRRLNLRVVAEGVEHEAQLEQLRRMQCPYVQGYLTGRPVSAEIARAL